MTSRVRGWGTTMRTLLYIIAILLIAAGMAVGLGSFYAPGQVVIGLNLESASILLTGGFVMLGLATVTAALLTVAEVLAGTRSAPSSGAGAGAGPGGAVAATGPAPDKSWPGNYGRRKGRGWRRHCRAFCARLAAPPWPPRPTRRAWARRSRPPRRAGCSRQAGPPERIASRR